MAIKLLVKILFIYVIPISCYNGFSRASENSTHYIDYSMLRGYDTLFLNKSPSVKNWCKNPSPVEADLF